MTIDSKRRAQLLTDAITERKSLRKWERDGSDPDTRPLTPAMDEIEKVQTMPKSERKNRGGGGRKPSTHDQTVRDAFLNGTIAHPATNGEIADVIGQARSTCFHVVNRLVAAGELVIQDTGPQRVWLTAAGKPGAVPERETKTRTRKVYAVKTVSGKVVHAAHAHRGENGQTFATLCNAPVANLAKSVNAEVSCKRCVTVLAADAA